MKSIASKTVYSYLYNSRILHYGVVGGISAAVDIGIVYFMQIFTPYGLAFAVITGFLTGLFVNFALNKVWTFQTRGDGYRKTQRQFILYILLVLCNLGFTYLTVRLLTELGIELLFAKIFTIGCTTLWNYILYKKYIFTKTSQAA